MRGVESPAQPPACSAYGLLAAPLFGDPRGTWTEIYPQSKARWGSGKPAFPALQYNWR